MIRVLLRACVFAPLACLALTPYSTWAQKPTPPNPQAPVLNPLAVSGGQRGSKIELLLTGTNLAGPTAVWTSFPAAVDIPKGDKNGEDNAKLKVIIDIPPTAPVGPHLLRLATTRGMSNLRVFSVDDLPQVVDNDKNTDKAAAQEVPTPCVLSARIDAEKSDWLKFKANAGQRLSFDVIARRGGSTLDPQLSIYNAKTGREIAHDNDSPGCQGDARLTYTFKEAGDYLAEVRDVLYRGGPEYFYRLRIGDFPLATTPVPMAAKRGSKLKVEFTGPSVEGVTPLDVAAPLEADVPAIWVAPKRADGPSGWPVVLALTNQDEAIEQEPNNEPSKAQRLSVPSGVTGRLMPSGDADNYVFAAKKGQKISIDVETLDLHSPTLVYFTIKNAKGAELAKSNPASAPPADQRLDFTAPEDGDFLIELQHLNLVGGPSEVYHLVLTPTAPGFDAALSLERYDIPAGSVAPIQVTVNRKGYNGPVELEVIGAKGLMGKGVIPAGPKSIATLLTVIAKSDVPMGPQAFSIVARATIDKTRVSQMVSAKAPLAQSLGNIVYPPLPWHNQVLMAVKEKAPFALAIALDPPIAVPGLPAAIKVTVQRDPGFEEAIELGAPGTLPPGISPLKGEVVAKDKKEAIFKLNLDAKAPLGEYQLLVGAKVKFKGKDITASTPPLEFVIAPPFSLKVEPETVALKPGAKAKLKVSATRNGGYKGPIALELRKLPANVSAAKAVLNPDQTSVEVDITAAPAAAPAEAKDADVLGTATALGNQQNASPALTVRVDKK